MKKLFTPESLERFLEETRVRSLMKRVNNGRSYPLTVPGGGNPLAVAIENFGGTVEACLVVDGILVPAEVTARVARDNVRRGESTNFPDRSHSMPVSMAASGKRKKQHRRIEVIEFQVNVDGHRILDSRVSENGVDTLSVCEDGTLIFDEMDTNHCVTSESAEVVLRVLREGESSMLPPMQAASPQDSTTPRPSNAKDADLYLINQILAGSLETFTNLVVKYEQTIFRFVRSQIHNDEDAADITQETLIAVYQSLSSFAGNSRLSTWIFGIASNEALRFNRLNSAQKRDRRKAASLEITKSKDLEADSFDPADFRFELPADYAERQEQTAALRAAIAQIANKGHQQVIEMYYFESMSYQEIAETLGRPIGTIKGWLNRTKPELEKLLCNIIQVDDSADELIA